MKILPFLVAVLFAFASCNDHTPSQKNSAITIDKKEPVKTTAEKIAFANGLENWDQVSEINFTFNVDRGENHSERSWSWKPKTNDITLKTATDTILFNRAKVDSTNMNYDAAFINDKYWLLAPYNLVWDEGTTITESAAALSPISKKELKKLTLTYGDEGGYTPGDAYDFYYNKDFVIEEWVFRKGNSPEPSMATTWEDYENFNGLNIAKTHKDSTGGFVLSFSNISVK